MPPSEVPTPSEPAEPGERSQPLAPPTPVAQPKPPPLPPWLAEPAPPALIGTALWFVVWLGLLGAVLLDRRPADELFWTTLAGWIIGLLGYSLFRWQRSAARRGSRLAQRGLGVGKDLPLP